jgi:hypothetical protein
MFKCLKEVLQYNTNDETISDQPTESLRELLLFGGTPLLFVENLEIV